MFWTKGMYEFKFEIIKSTKKEADVVYVPLRPEEIWNFNIKYEKTNATWLKHSKHTYKIDPNNFTAKDVFLYDMVDLGKWDISKEALDRTIVISEVDRSGEITTETTNQVQVAKGWNFSGNTKLNIGLKLSEIVNVGGELGFTGTADKKTTTTKTIKVTTRKNLTSDDLGRISIYFYDPIILSKNGSIFELKTYNTGHVKFGIIAK